MKAVYLKVRLMAIAWLSACLVACTSNVEADLEVIEYPIAFQASLTDIYGTVSDAQGMGDFRLWGWYLTEDSPVPIFEGDKVTDGTTGQWRKFTGSMLCLRCIHWKGAERESV